MYYKFSPEEQNEICFKIGEWYLVWKHKIDRKKRPHTLGVKKEKLKDIFCNIDNTIYPYPPGPNGKEITIHMIWDKWKNQVGPISHDVLLNQIAIETLSLYLLDLITIDDIVWLTSNLPMNPLQNNIE